MKKTRFSEEQMVTILREADQRPVPEVAKKHGVRAQTIYGWRKHFGTLDPADIKRLRQLEGENGRLKQMVADRPRRHHRDRGSRWLGGCRRSGMRERRQRVAANNRRCFVDKRVIFESRHHEEGKIHAARDVARQNGVANVPTPDWQTLARTFFEVAPSYNRPHRVACEHAPASLHLVIEVHNAGETSKPADDMHEKFDLPRVHVLAVPCNVPPAREHDARPRTCVVENSLRCS